MFLVNHSAFGNTAIDACTHNRKKRICRDGFSVSRRFNPLGRKRRSRRRIRHNTINATISVGDRSRFTTQFGDAYTTFPIPSPMRRKGVCVNSAGACEMNCAITLNLAFSLPLFPAAVVALSS